MASLTRYNHPLRRNTSLTDAFGLSDRLFDHLSWPLTQALNDQVRAFSVDITDKGSRYLVEAEIPGASKENINISIDGNQITISAEMKKENERKEGETLLWSERSYGRTSRSFTLEQYIDEEHTKASYHDGILKLDLPKKNGSHVKQIKIS